MPKQTRVADVPNLGPTIARLRQLVAEAGDHLLLGDGPPHPDAKLLDLCAEGLHHLRAAERAYEKRPDCPGRWTDEIRVERDRLMQLYNDGIVRARAPLALIAKMPATTAAGIYAKAMVVRASRTGAAQLAMTLADDLVNCAALRAVVWAAERETGSAIASNVVPLAPHERRA